MIVNKLSSIQKQLKAPKSQFNKFGNYNYRNCEDILEALKPLMDDDTSLTLSDELINIGDRYYIKATATLYHKDEKLQSTAFAREAVNKKGMDDAQITGACSSYARKYALNALLLIDDTKDADSMDNSTNNKKNYNYTKNNQIKNTVRPNVNELDIAIQKAFFHLTDSGKNQEMIVTLHKDIGIKSINEIYKKPDEDKKEILDFLRRKYKQNKEDKKEAANG